MGNGKLNDAPFTLFETAAEATSAQALFEPFERPAIEIGSQIELLRVQRNSIQQAFSTRAVLAGAIPGPDYANGFTVMDFPPGRVNLSRWP